MFLQEQNEILKCVIKELKKNNNIQLNECEWKREEGCSVCCATKLEVRAANKKIEDEIENLKKTLNEEQIRRGEEDNILQSLETSMSFLKNKLLSGLQSNLTNEKG